jgi:cytochrome P450
MTKQDVTESPEAAREFHSASGNPDRPHDPADISSRAFWSTSPQEREKTFALLRTERPVSWHRPFDDQLMEDPQDYGFWAITRHADLVEVTKRHDDFRSGQGAMMENWPPEFIAASASIAAMDPPDHTQLRRLVASAFTPRQMRRIEDRIKRNAAQIIDDFLERARSAGGTIDFVSHCAALLPIQTFSDIMGIPEEHRHKAAHEMEVLTGWNDPELTGHTREEISARMAEAINYMHELSGELVADRRANPTEDLFTALAFAEVEGQRLTDFQIGGFFSLLTIGGTDTTRQSTSHGVRALTEFPEQRAWLLEDLAGRLPTAIEEIVRWATPIMTFRRTAARDFEFRGQQITAGDKVVMFYSSANRDEAVFDRPNELDLSRDPNPHVAFGGGGVHHCLGNQLARLQLRILFEDLLTRAPDITADEPVLMPGNFFNVFKRMNATVNG